MPRHIEVLLERVAQLQRAGLWASAVDLCEEGYQHSVECRDVGSIIDCLNALGSSYRQDGNWSLAEEYYELAQSIALINDDHQRASRSLNGIAIAHQERGDTEIAEELYLQARSLALLAGDVLTTGRINQNLGTLSNIRGDFTAALDFYTASLQSYEQVRYEQGIAGVLNNLGMLHTDRHEFDEAEACLRRALSVSKSIRDIVTQGIIHTNYAELLLARGDLDRARISCDHAFEIASQLVDNRIKADTLKFYGVIFRETGKPHLAEAHFRQAIALASEHNNLLIAAESQRELSLVLRAQDRNREALEALNDARVLFSAVRAEQDQADIRQRVSQLEDDFLSLVRIWGESIEAKDQYTRGHCHRVAEYACLIARAVGMAEDDIVWFRMGAFLHDLGKTEVPEEILNKPGPLTDEERVIMENHTIVGDEILANFPFPWEIRPMARSHHERWDGGGYPDGTSGSDIPISARILRIADVFDALTTARSYRQPLTAGEALQVMEEDHGSFDPDLFEIFRILLPEVEELVQSTMLDGYFPQKAVI
jgi:putative nucleotidyltransferase with HDIG domain